MSRRLGPLAVAAVAVVVAAAHVGSPDTLFEGTAGPYPVRVIIRTPGVVPGLADISVRVTGGPRVRTVTVLPLRGGLPTAQLPPPDTARPVPGNPGLYTAQLWLMTFGAYSVQVNVAGDAGSGTAVVPVMAVASRRLGFSRPLALALGAAGLLLVLGAVTIVFAAARESTLPAGVEADPARTRRAWGVAAAAAVVVGLGLFGARRWWNTEDRAFVSSIFRSFRATTTVTPPATLRFAISDSAWLRRNWTPLIPDHGKLVHLFLIRSDQGAFAHLHPIGRDSITFDAALPPLPAGPYRVYADIVHESGFTQTLVDTVTVASGAGARWRPTDPDDAWVSTGRGKGEGGRVAALADGSTMTWERGAEPLVAGRDLELSFTVRGPDGRPAALQSYMGLAAHAALTRDDGSVFVHLHPLGTISMASQLVYALRQPGDTVRGRLGQRITAYADTARHAAHAPVLGAVSFPYAFPRAGRYRLWIQIKRNDRILTGAFDVDVR